MDWSNVKISTRLFFEIDKRVEGRGSLPDDLAGEMILGHDVAAVRLGQSPEHGVLRNQGPRADVLLHHTGV